MAAEYVEVERTAPTSASEVGSRLQDVLVPRSLDDRIVFKRFRDWKVRQHPFTRDSSLQFKARAYELETDLGDGGSPSTAMGGNLAYRSGEWRDLVSFSATWYGSFSLRSREDFDLSGLLRTDGEDLSVLGQAYVELKRANTGARIYRQSLNIPYINRNDSRMIPNTFEAYMLGRQNTAFQYAVGHVTKVKLRNSDRFVPMAEAAGAEGARGGTTVLGAYLSLLDDQLDVGAVTQHTKDVFNTSYAELNWTAHVSEKLEYKLTGQYTLQQDIGSALLGPISTSAWGVRGVTSYKNLVLSLAFTETGDSAQIRSPFGGRPSFSSLMIRNFQRAGERATVLGISYNFAALGLPSLGASANFAWGNGARDQEGIRQPESREADLTVDYRPASGTLNGLWLRLRYAVVYENDLGKVGDQIRLILNYDLPVL